MILLLLILPSLFLSKQFAGLALFTSASDATGFRSSLLPHDRTIELF
jgi:hypothetical protein